MMALGYTLAGVLLVIGLVVPAGIVAAIWLLVSGTRPELLERDRTTS
jgi:hypothetical protein